MTVHHHKRELRHYNLFKNVKVNYTFTIYDKTFTKNNLSYLYKEWAIWSKCFGKVIVINGISSVGKTTLATFLCKFGFNKISIDDIVIQYVFADLWNIMPDKMLCAKRALINENDILKIFFRIKVNKDQYSSVQIGIIDDFIAIAELIPKHSLMELNDKIYNKAKKFIFSGQNVVIDTLLSTQDEINLFSYCCSYYPISIILLYSSLEENLKKCFARNAEAFKYNLLEFRNPACIIDQYCTFYTCISKRNVNLSDKIIEKWIKL